MVTSIANVASTASAQSNTGTKADAASITGNYTTFLNLLTAQIKNQDPLSPMDTTQWTNQLVQYSSVEQQLKGNQYLEKIANQAGVATLNSAVGYIGKTVTADTDVSTLSNGQAAWSYALGAQAATVKATIKNSNGDTVWSNMVDGKDAGINSFSWNGKDSAGNKVPDGDYTLSITATDALDKTVTAGVGISGVVTSASTDSTGAIIMKVGNSTVPMSRITSVS